MTKEQLKSIRFVGVVEDNVDPKKIGRCKIRITELHGEIPVEDIPWAKSRKDLAGNVFSVPDKGKVVSVIFENGSIYKPEYIQAEHFNPNLETKLENLSESDYNSFRGVMFDQSTQIYRTKSKGLILDHEYTNVNLTQNGNMDFNLRNNDAKMLLGTFDGAQQAVLGNHFSNWLKRFLEAMNGTPYIGNLGAPVALQPTIKIIQEEYVNIEVPKVLSKNVKIVDNGYVKRQRRDYEDVEGDPWKSTVKNNALFKKNSNGEPPKEDGRNKDEEENNPNQPTTNNDNMQQDQPTPKMDIIFMGGLDDRKDSNTGKVTDLTLEQQVGKLKRSVGDKKIQSHRYNDINGILKTMKKNPNAKVILFSGACVYAKTVFDNIESKGNLFIVEPFGKNNETVDKIKNVNKSGLPLNNIILGPTIERGNGILQNTTLTPSGIDHLGAITFVGRMI